MSNQKEVIKAFEDNVISLSMDESHVMAGLSNGKVRIIELQGKGTYTLE